MPKSFPEDNVFRHSTPLPPKATLQQRSQSREARSQDTNYIGITIGDQDEQPRTLDVTAAPSTTASPTTDYRRSFNGFPTAHSSLNLQGDLSNDTRTNLTPFVAQAPPSAQTLPLPNDRPARQSMRSQHQRKHSESSSLHSTTTLSRHSSITLPAIDTKSSQLCLTFSASTDSLNEPRSATLPLSFPFSPRNPPLDPSKQSHLQPDSSVRLYPQHQQQYKGQLPSPSSPRKPAFPTPSLSSTHIASSSSAYSPVHASFASSATSIPEGSALDFALPDIQVQNSNGPGRQRMSGAFVHVQCPQDLKPLPPEKRGNGKSQLLALTRDLNQTYQNCNEGFRYSTVHNPRRVLTKPSKPCGNDGYDNEDFDYILYVNDILGSAEGHKYVILDVLGAGTFGQVVKCRNIKTQEIFAVKVVKNKMAYFKQSMMEVAILEMLNERHDPRDEHHILRLKDTFIHRKHLCLVFELLSVNLYELIKQNQFRGLSTNLVRVFTAQILDALTVLNEARIIHCDLKPENILLKNLESPTIKVIDFGSACHEVQTMYTYIQSRFYRSPEVLVGLPYTSAIDMWSLGCIATELFLGLPLFPGSSEYNQMSRIVEMLGVPPTYMIEMGKHGHRYFEKYTDQDGKKRYRFKSLEQYSREQGKAEQPSKRYFSATTLEDLINNYPILRKSSMTPQEIEKEKQTRLAFIDFLHGLLNLNHLERWSPQQAKQHPFVTGEEFTGPFKPSFVPRKQSHPMKQSSSIPSPLPIIHDEASSPAQPSFAVPRAPCPPPYYPSTEYPPQHLAQSTYSSSLPTYNTNNLFLIPQGQSTMYSNQATPLHSDRNSHLHYTSPVLPFAERTIPHHPGPPTISLSSSYQSHDQSKQMSMLDSWLERMMLPNDQNTTGGRPRANTVGTVQRQLPRLSFSGMNGRDMADTLPYQNNARYNGWDPRYSMPNQQVPPPMHYAEIESIRIDNPQNSFQQPSFFDGHHGSQLLPPPPPPPPPPVHNIPDSTWDWTGAGGRVVDLERDGDLIDDSVRRMSHRRSNSSVQFTDTSQASKRSSMVNSLHRRVRGHPPSVMYSRQDLEWDGVHSTPSTSTPRTSSIPIQRRVSNSSSFKYPEDSRDWGENDKQGWALA